MFELLIRLYAIFELFMRVLTLFLNSSCVFTFLLIPFIPFMHD